MALTKISTDGVKDDAVTAGKIPANAVGSSELADNAVDTAAIQDGAVNESKFVDIASGRILGRLASGTGDITQLTATSVRSIINVADGATNSPTTTINNNADNRVITGDASSNTLNAESSMTYTSNTLKLSDSSNDTSLLHLVGNSGSTTRGLKIGTSRATGALNDDGAAVYDAIDSESNAYGAQHRFKIAGTDCLTIGYNGAKGYVGINDSVPYPDPIASNTLASHLELGVPSGADQGTTIKLQGRDGGSNLNRCQIGWAGAHNRFDIQCNGSIKFQIQPNSDVSVVSGNLKIETAGKGIDFSATSGSGTSELFDDYEEGTFSATITSGGTVTSFTQNKCSYTKIGRLVTFQIYLQINGNGNGNILAIGNLPFTSTANTTGYGAAYLGYQNNVFQQSGNVIFYVGQNNSQILAYKNNGSIYPGNGGMVFGNRDFILVGSYVAA